MSEETTQSTANNTTQEAVWTPKKGKVQRVRTPLPSELARQKAEVEAEAAAASGAAAGAGSGAGAAKGVNAAFIRAENEDDDGYDPYSDRVEVVPFFESDPWF